MAEQATSLCVIGIALEHSLGFGFGFVNTLRFPIHFCQAFADNRRFWIERVSFLVVVDGLGCEFATAGGFVLLLRDVAHGVVEIGVGAAAGGAGRWLDAGKGRHVGRKVLRHGM